MGGNHSKSKKSSPDIEQTGDANTPKGLQSKNSVKKKKGNRNSVKIKTEKRTLKKQKSVRGADFENVNPGDCQANHKFNSTVYRKKSSCPSCDAKDTLLGKNRSRSGSDKSLRFSDFNKVLRRTKIYDWETSPVEIPLDGVPDPEPEDICYVCGVYTGHHVRICRVCLKAYHDGCLQKIGHPLNDRARHLIVTGQWSCHQCVALNHLLTQEEVKKVMEDLEDYDISREKISEQDYLSYCKQSLIKEGKIFTAEKELSSSERFRMAAQSGYISWNDFLNIESIRILNKRCKDSLVHLLTQAEIAEARKAFRQLDKQGIGLVSKAEVQLFFDGSKSRVSTYFPDNSIIYIDEDLESPVTWPEFLRDRAIYYLGQRPNLGKYASSDNIDKNESAMSPSFHSLDDDDDYTTCASDTEPSAKGALIPPCTNSFSDSADGNMPMLTTTSTMLEDFKAEMDKCCDRHKLSIDQPDLDLEEAKLSYQ
ncbi:PHD finger protein 24-like isoform X2 [Physella acuta]|uniref:PHD finger protein 24-like isoform X2 n=1 Tax=Physella acuta TaxID=109671 RepID=UPI0027DE0BDB|nr:PHD finger protein 24-like isoform X2 [Physella acuta]